MTASGIRRIRRGTEPCRAGVLGIGRAQGWPFDRHGSPDAATAAANGGFGRFCKTCFVYDSDTLDGERSWDFGLVTGVDQELEHVGLKDGNCL